MIQDYSELLVTWLPVFIITIVFLVLVLISFSRNKKTVSEWRSLRQNSLKIQEETLDVLREIRDALKNRTP